MEGEIALDNRGSAKSSTANPELLSDHSGASSSTTPTNQWDSAKSSIANLESLNEHSGASSSSTRSDEWGHGRAIKLLNLLGDVESSILTRLRDTMYHQLKDTEFTRQELPAWKPILTPKWAVTLFLIISTLAIPIGIITLAASHQVVEIVYRYDLNCMPPSVTLISDPVSYIQDPNADHSCNATLVVPKHMRSPVLVLYQLTRFHQNHIRYMKSRSTRQHQGEDVKSVASCHPVAHLSKRKPIIPCGLMAWTLFNDTYSFNSGNTSIPVKRTGIAWKSDVRVKFSSKVFPQNFPNNIDEVLRMGSSTRFPIGGASLDPNVPLSQDENLMVWMRPAPMPTFSKLYGRIHQDLHAGQVLQVGIHNVYNSYSFHGSKSLVLSTSTFLGGKNPFLGHAYLTMGVLCVVMALATFLVQLHHPRTLGDPSDLSWNRHLRRP